MFIFWGGKCNPHKQHRGLPPRRHFFLRTQQTTSKGASERCGLDLHISSRARSTMPAPRAPPLRVALAALLFATAARPVIGENVSCPCLTTAAWALVGGGNNSEPCNRVHWPGEVGEALCYNSSYGLGGCSAHDAGLAPRCEGASPPSFCTAEWCFVDPDKCRTSGVRFRGARYLLDGAGDAFYSYETCGGDSSAWDDQVLTALNGVTLRAGVPLAYLYPDHYVVDKAGAHVNGVDSYQDLAPGHSLKGVWLELFEEVAARANFTLEWYPVSYGSRALQASSAYTACVQDVEDQVFLSLETFLIPAPVLPVPFHPFHHLTDQYPSPGLRHLRRRLLDDGDAARDERVHDRCAQRSVQAHSQERRRDARQLLDEAAPRGGSFHAWAVANGARRVYMHRDRLFLVTRGV
jgi:hypothetical protein